MNMEALTCCARRRTNRGVEHAAIGMDLTVASQAPRHGAEVSPNSSFLEVSKQYQLTALPL